MLFRTVYRDPDTDPAGKVTRYTCLYSGLRTLAGLQRWRFALDKTMNMVYYRTMIMLNIHEAKTQLSRYLKGLKKGQRIVLCRRNVPVAEIVPLDTREQKREQTPRPIGLAAGEFRVPATFFEALPDEILAGFGEFGGPKNPEAAG